MLISRGWFSDEEVKELDPKALRFCISKHFISLKDYNLDKGRIKILDGLYSVKIWHDHHHNRVLFPCKKAKFLLDAQKDYLLKPNYLFDFMIHVNWVNLFLECINDKSISIPTKETSKKSMINWPSFFSWTSTFNRKLYRFSWPFSFFGCFRLKMGHHY